jgi:hypothetical protein
MDTKLALRRQDQLARGADHELCEEGTTSVAFSAVAAEA